MSNEETTSRTRPWERVTQPTSSHHATSSSHALAHAPAGGTDVAPHAAPAATPSATVMGPAPPLPSASPASRVVEASAPSMLQPSCDAAGFKPQLSSSSSSSTISSTSGMGSSAASYPAVSASASALLIPHTTATLPSASAASSALMPPSGLSALSRAQTVAQSLQLALSAAASALTNALTLAQQALALKAELGSLVRSLAVLRLALSAARAVLRLLGRIFAAVPRALGLLPAGGSARARARALQGLALEQGLGSAWAAAGAEAAGAYHNNYFGHSSFRGRNSDYLSLAAGAGGRSRRGGSATVGTVVIGLGKACVAAAALWAAAQYWRPSSDREPPARGSNSQTVVRLQQDQQDQHGQPLLPQVDLDSAWAEAKKARGAE